MQKPDLKAIGEHMYEKREKAGELGLWEVLQEAYCNAPIKSERFAGKKTE